MKHKDNKNVHMSFKKERKNDDLWTHFFQTCYSKQNCILSLKFMLWQSVNCSLCSWADSCYQYWVYMLSLSWNSFLLSTHAFTFMEFISWPIFTDVMWLVWCTIPGLIHPAVDFESCLCMCSPILAVMLIYTTLELGSTVPAKCQCRIQMMCSWLPMRFGFFVCSSSVLTFSFCSH